MSKDYYILYVMTPAKGLQKKIVERKPYTHLMDIVGVSFFIYSAFRLRNARTLRSSAMGGRIKFVCWCYDRNSRKGSYTEPVCRALAFGKKKKKVV